MLGDICSATILSRNNLSVNSLDEHTISCPYCGEPIDVLIDSSEAGQEYIEDCQVCCRPIIFAVTLSDTDQAIVSVRSEDESF